MIEQVKREVLTKLLGNYGCKRFLRDGYQTVKEVGQGWGGGEQGQREVETTGLRIDKMPVYLYVQSLNVCANVNLELVFCFCAVIAYNPIVLNSNQIQIPVCAVLPLQYTSIIYVYICILYVQNTRFTISRYFSLPGLRGTPPQWLQHVRTQTSVSAGSQPFILPSGRAEDV